MSRPTSRRRLFSEDEIEEQELPHEDSLPVNRNRQSARAKFMKNRAARNLPVIEDDDEEEEISPQHSTPRSRSTPETTSAANQEMVCICVPRSSVKIINDGHQSAPPAYERNRTNEMSQKMMDDDDVFFNQQEHDDESNYKSLPDFETSLLEVEDDLVSLPVLGKNYRVNSFR